ncbi:MAG: twin-arginine translocation signal domain-containing protein [bacterium]
MKRRNFIKGAAAVAATPNFSPAPTFLRPTSRPRRSIQAGIERG